MQTHKKKMKDKRMYKIILEDDSDLLVSEKHKVYAKNSIRIVMVPELVKNEKVSFNFEHQNKRTDMDSFVVAKIPPEILEVVNKCDIAVDELAHLISDCNGKCFILMSKFIKNLLQCRGYNELKSHFNPINLSNSSKVIGLHLPDLSSLAVCSIDLTTSLATDPLTSRVSSSDISEISRIFFFNCSSFISFNVSANALLATEDQLIKSVLSISDFNSSGTDNVMVPILDLQSNYLYYVNTKEIFKSFGEKEFSLMPVTDVYEDVNNGKEVYSLNENNLKHDFTSLEDEKYMMLDKKMNKIEEVSKK